VRIAVGDQPGQIHFLGSHGRQVAAPFVGIEQDVVGDHVELLLRLALDVLAAGFAQGLTQAALADGDGDMLAGPRHHLDQQPQVGGQQVLFALFFDQVAGEGDTTHEDSGKTRMGKGIEAAF